MSVDDIFASVFHSTIFTHLGGELVAGSGSFEALSHVQRVHLGKVAIDVGYML